MVLRLALKPKWYDAIESGGKENEYRDVTSYYTDRLVSGSSAHPRDGDEGWVKCSDGRWRKFRPYSCVEFVCAERKMRIRLRSVDCDGERYILRLGAKLQTN